MEKGWEPQEVVNDSCFVDELNSVQDDVSEGAIKVMTRSQKYKCIAPKIEKLLGAIIKCGTENVKMYEKEIESIITNVLEGKSLHFMKEGERRICKCEITEATDLSKSNEASSPVEKRFKLDFYRVIIFLKLEDPDYQK